MISDERRQSQIMIVCMAAVLADKDCVEQCSWLAIGQIKHDIMAMITSYSKKVDKDSLRTRPDFAA